MSTKEERRQNRERYKEGMKRMKRKTLLFLGAIFFLIIFGGSLWGIVAVNIPYSSGERSVRIIKLSERGLIWKTWEAEAVLTQGDGFATTYIWGFSVDNQDPNKDRLVSEIKDAFETGKTVKARYEQRAGAVPWRSGTSYWIKEIRY